MECRVCSTKLPKEYSRCPYCGYGNEVLFTVDSDNSPKYREELLLKIKSISVMARGFQYSETKQAIHEVERKSLFKALKGKRCSEKIIFSEDWIAHFDESEEIEIPYNFAGAPRLAVVRIRPEPGEGRWRLGLHINQELRLEVYVCSEPVLEGASSRLNAKVVKVGTVDLDFSAPPRD